MTNRSVLAALALYAAAVAGWLVLAGCSKDAPPVAAKPATATTAAAQAEAPTPAGMEVAILAGGCFWGMEDILRDIPGVVATVVGYEAGAEVVKVTFDPARLAYATLLEDWYFKMHDPTTKNRQGNDVGPQYRSAIFATSPEQRRIAEEVKAKVGASGFWKAPIVTEIADAGSGGGSGSFSVAEEFHQDYLEKHPGGYTCHYMRE